MDKNENRVIKSDTLEPCGCQVTEFSDGGRVVRPCPPCGLMNAAESLAQAGRALAAVASRIRADAIAQGMSQVAKKVVTG